MMTMAFVQIASVAISLFSTWAIAQSVEPTNSTNSSPPAQFVLETSIGGMEIRANITPLTHNAGLDGTSSQLQNIDQSGPLYLTTPESVAQLRPGFIAYLSCEPSDYRGAMDAQQTIDLAASNKPNAIVLYSPFADTCTFDPTNNFPYQLMYTMVNASNSQTIFDGLEKSSAPYPNSNIHVVSNSSSNSDSNNNLLGHSPTTAVAMIILYSITGVITALFLLIIIVGAIRAHRHPERYGPRRVIGGGPRQGRARGIARAMLETIPIIKFGDREEDKPGDTRRDIELASSPQENVVNRSGEATTSERPDTVRTEAATDTNRQESDNPMDNGLVCSVCTDDFVKGQDVRVLPCKHKFHPECIDPWLLNVSGTCPLCRVDLVPTTSHDSNLDDDLEDSSVPTEHPADATEPTAPRNRRSRILSTLNIGRMRHATPEERMEALRTLRTENGGQAADPEQEAGSSSRGRFGRRISRAFGGSRPQSGVVSRPVSEVPEIPADGDTRREGTFSG